MSITNAAILTLDPEQRIDVRAVAKLCGVSVRTVWRLVRTSASFPKPARFGLRITRWRVGDVLDYLDSRRPQKGVV